MSYDFNADDILQMAEQIEINGALFYRESAEKVTDSGAKEFLLGLASMEDEHEKTFAAIRSQLSDKEKEGTVFDPQGEAAGYLKALADTTRLRMLKLMLEHEGALCVTAMANQLGVTQSAVSQHMRVLRQTGFVSSCRCGCYVHYAVDRAKLKDYQQVVLEALDPGPDP